MTNKEKKDLALHGDPKRQAVDSLRGYVYQIWHSVHAWLELADEEIPDYCGPYCWHTCPVCRIDQSENVAQYARDASGGAKKRQGRRRGTQDEAQSEPR